MKNDAPTVVSPNERSCGELALVDQSPSRWLAWWPSWVPTSMKHLIEAEARLLSVVRSRLHSRYLPVRFSRGQLWTVTADAQETTPNDDRERTPLVLVHGFAAGIGIWAQNFDALSQRRSVHAFDLLGFGRSSRPKFSDDATLAELEWVESIEDWRKSAGVEKMILCGHSLGGFLASSYALEHPDRVRHLILVDPWGSPERPPESERQLAIPTWVRALGMVASWFNPLATLRAAGPFGPGLVRRARPDLGRRYAATTGGDSTAIFDYVYHCNAQKPSGEAAFRALTIPFGWAKRPMIARLPQTLPPQVPITFVYGGKSWIDAGPGYEIQHQLRPNSYVNVQVIKGAGHHVYVDNAPDFNQAILGICDLVDEDGDTQPLPRRLPPPPPTTTTLPQ